MPVFKDHSFRFGASSQGEDVYEIEKSIRFNDDDTPHLSRTPSSGGNRKTWTFSTWFKLSHSGISQAADGIFSAVTDNNNFCNISINNATYSIDFLQYNGGTSYRINLSDLLQDPHAWYHLVAVYDSTDSTETERMRLYINGERRTRYYQEAYPTLNYDSNVNHTSTLHNIGRGFNGGTYSGYYFDGYMSEIQLIDGYAYGPEYFGEFNDSNIWIPKEYTGSYGTNGFYLKGEDSSNLGNDSSDNNNDYASTNLETNDQMPDSPSNNWCVLSTVNKTPSIGIFNGGLGHNYYSNQYNDGATGSLMVPNSGKWYWEQIVIAANIWSGYCGWKTQGVTNRKHTPTNVPNGGGSTVGRWGPYLFKDGPQVQNVGSAAGGNQVTAVMIDLDNYEVQFYADGSTFGSAISIASTYSGWLPFISTNTVGSEQGVAPLQTGYTANYVARVNFGQDSTFGGRLAGNTHTDANGLGNFKKQPPTGALAICSRNIITGLV